MNRRLFLRTSAQAGALGLAGFAGLATAGCAGANGAKASGNRAATSKLGQPAREERELMTEGFHVALDKYLYPALLDRIYPGHFIIAPDGRVRDRKYLAGPGFVADGGSLPPAGTPASRVGLLR